jgi:hypothetical protein
MQSATHYKKFGAFIESKQRKKNLPCCSTPFKQKPLLHEPIQNIQEEAYEANMQLPKLGLVLLPLVM